MKPASIATFIVLVGATWLGCSSVTEPEPVPQRASLSPIAATPEARRVFPNLEALYGGEHGIYRGCGPNNGVCHNSREFPNLSSLGSLVENIGLRCNERRDDPTEIHDLCEREGDRLRAGGEPAVEIAAVLPYSDSDVTRTYRLRTREPVALAQGAAVSIVRPGPPKDIELVSLTDFGATVALDVSDETGHTLIVSLPPAPIVPDGDDPPDDVLGRAFSRAGVPGEPRAIQVGDPNRNGVFGATLGGRLIAPGDPARSYLMTRLVDPSAGPIMPRANCCFWTKASLRATWCWIAGLAPDGHNALDPIAYDKCPPGPADIVDYPEPGPSCETSGMCPVKPKGVLGDEPTFANIYDNLLVHTCAGSGCHVGGSAGGLDLTTLERAHASLVGGGRVVPGRPPESSFFVRISPELCTGDCVRMPKDGPPLDRRALEIIERWILEGARLD